MASSRDRDRRGRTTPKGTRPGSTTPTGPPPDRTPPPASRRYTPPVPREAKESPRWVPVVMWVLLGLGTATILLNYLGLLPGATDNWYLLLGLALITGGFVTATQYR